MQQDNNQKTVIIATIAFLVGFGLAWLILSNKMPSLSTGGSNATSTAETGQSQLGKFSILVHDQPEGVRVAIAQAGFEELGWVVIHEDDNGKPGRILGAQLFDAGTWNDSTVDLLRGTLADHKYYAMLHRDNGDRAFDPKNDLPITSDDGAPVMMSFMATAASSMDSTSQ